MLRYCCPPKVGGSLTLNRNQAHVQGRAGSGPNQAESKPLLFHVINPVAYCLPFVSFEPTAALNSSEIGIQITTNHAAKEYSTTEWCSKTGSKCIRLQQEAHCGSTHETVAARFDLPKELECRDCGETGLTTIEDTSQCSYQASS